jgi:hypothetical protein
MGALGGVDPIFRLPSLPFLATTPEQGQALAAVARPAYERARARHNQILLFQSRWPAAGIWAHRPMDSVEALRGVRVRTADANGVLAFRAVGAGQRLMETRRHFTAIEYEGGARGGGGDRGAAVGGDEDAGGRQLRPDARGRRHPDHRALARVPPGAPRGRAGRGGRLAGR